MTQETLAGAGFVVFMLAVFVLSFVEPYHWRRMRTRNTSAIRPRNIQPSKSTGQNS